MRDNQRSQSVTYNCIQLGTIREAKLLEGWEGHV
jgi:hypothetical protein